MLTRLFVAQPLRPVRRACAVPPQLTSVTALAYETYLALLALNKTWQTNRTRHALGKRTSLMSLLVRDNIVYFFLYVSPAHKYPTRFGSC